MKITIDTTDGTLTTVSDQNTVKHCLYSKKSFELLSKQWVKVGWSLQHYLTFSWMGRPILQLPEDLLRLQEVLFDLRPEVIVETGVYRGGSLMFLATMCKTLGRVIGIDINIPNDVELAIQEHLLSDRIELIKGNSVEKSVIEQVARKISGASPIVIILDSNHSRQHVNNELTAYARFMTPGSYFVVTDGVMQDLADVPGGDPDWVEDNPCSATHDFLSIHPEFELVEPVRPFNEGKVRETPTYWPQAWLRRKD